MSGRDWTGLFFALIVVCGSLIGGQYLYQEHVQDMAEQGYEQVITNGNVKIWVKADEYRHTDNDSEFVRGAGGR